MSLMHASRDRRRGGFTLVELIVVVLIIALLIAILLPALAAVQQRGAKLQAETMLRRIHDACTAYQQDFRALPGYVSDSTIASSTAAEFTATENLTISLMGGFVDSGGDYTLPDGQRVANSQLGYGPKDAEERQLEPYFTPKKGELRRVPGSTGTDPNPIKTIVDPQNGLPVLYFRKHGNGQPVSASAGTSASFWIEPVEDYVQATGLEGADGGSFDQSSDSLLGGMDSAAANALAWTAANETLSNLGNSADGANGSEDVVGGAVLLLTAGDDGIYLNKDTRSEITSKASLNGFDDVWAVGVGE